MQISSLIVLRIHTCVRCYAKESLFIVVNHNVWHGCFSKEILYTVEFIRLFVRLTLDWIVFVVSRFRDIIGKSIRCRIVWKTLGVVSKVLSLLFIVWKWWWKRVRSLLCVVDEVIAIDRRQFNFWRIDQSGRSNTIQYAGYQIKVRRDVICLWFSPMRKLIEVGEDFVRQHWYLNRCGPR